MEKTKHISSLGSLNASRKYFPTPRLKKKLSVKIKTMADSRAENKAIGVLISHTKGRKKVATILFKTSIAVLDVFMEKPDPPTTFTPSIALRCVSVFCIGVSSL